MNKYINAEAAKGAIERVCFGLVLDEETEKALTDAIDETQAEDVKKNVYGKWEKVPSFLPNYHYFVCSVCMTEALQDESGAVQSTFCPNCGAKMEVETE